MSSKKVIKLITLGGNDIELRGNKLVDPDFATPALERSVTAAQLNKFFNLSKSRRESGQESISVRNNRAFQEVIGVDPVHSFEIYVDVDSGEFVIGCKKFSKKDTATIKRWAKRVVTASKNVRVGKTSSSKQQAA